MATKLGVILADFSTSLATAMAIGATTATLQSATDDDSVALPAGTYYFAIDGDNSQKEHIQVTLSGTSLTAIQSVSRQGVLTSGCARTHRVGSLVALTDFAHIKFINDLLAGATNLNASTPLGYDSTASISTANQLATKAYVDGVAIAGAADATTTVKGIAKASVAPASPTAPIFVGDNDPRVPTTAQVGYIPTTGQKDALASTTTPASTNLYLTQKDFQKSAELYAADAGANDTYAITLSPAPAAYTTGMTVRFKANTANTGAATLNVNSLGAKTIKRKASTDLNDNDIAAGQIVTVVYDGTNFIMQSAPNTPGGYEIVNATGTGPSTIGGSVTVTVTCSAGKKVIGGGGTVATPASCFISNSYPSANNIWSVTFTSSANSASGTITAYAVAIDA
jgi:hypothetical protein